MRLRQNLLPGSPFTSAEMEMLVRTMVAALASAVIRSLVWDDAILLDKVLHTRQIGLWSPSLKKYLVLSHVSPLHAVSAVSAMIMSAIVIVGLLYRPRTRLFRTVGWTSIFLLCVYLLNSFVLALHGE